MNRFFALYTNSMFCLQFTSRDRYSLLFYSILPTYLLKSITSLNSSMLDMYSVAFIFWNCFVKYGTSPDKDVLPFSLDYSFSFFSIFSKLLWGILSQSFFLKIFKQSSQKYGMSISKKVESCKGLRQSYLIALENFFSSNFCVYW